MSQLQWMQWFWLAIAIAGLLLGGYLLMKLFRHEARRLALRAAKEHILDPATLQWIEEISRGIRLAVFALVAILMIFFTLRVLGHPAVAGWNLQRLLEWIMDRGVRVVFLLAGAFLCIKIVHIFVSKIDILIRATDASPAAELERQKRAHTISAILRNFSTVVIAVIFGLMLLEELNINTTPILTSLGVIGVALGFGAQRLVGDLLSGFFHIFENQIRVGDVAIINGTGGLVQEIRLRTTVLRGLDGTVHVFRNGAIDSLSNMTKDFSYFLLELGVAYKEDTDRVCDVVRQVAAGMQADEAFGKSILEPVEILGVDDFGDSAVVIKLRIKTIPIKQWEVGREFRRRLKYRLDQEGIEIPFPHQTIYFGEASKPFQVDVHGSSEGQRPAQPI